MDRRVKLQGHGPGGLVGTQREPLEPPDDPRLNVPGSVIDGRYFRDNFPDPATPPATDWATRVNASKPFAGFQDIPGGADITVVARGGAFTSGFPAAIDGFGLTLGRGGGAGGIYVNGFARFLRVTNNILEGNGGEFGGALVLGLPESVNSIANNENDEVTVRFNRVLGNGGLNLAGGIGIYNGADGYAIADNDICANYSVEYGGGVSHLGRSPGGSIRDNRVIFNDAFDEGGGINIGGELRASGLSRGSGRVTAERNEIQAEHLQRRRRRHPRPERERQPHRHHQQHGGRQRRHRHRRRDRARRRLERPRSINNTIAENATTATAQDTDFEPHGAGLVSEPHSDPFQATLPPGAPTFSDADWSTTSSGTTARTRSTRRCRTGASTRASSTSRSSTHWRRATSSSRASRCSRSPTAPRTRATTSGGDPNFVTAVPAEFTIEPNRLNPARGHGDDQPARPAAAQPCRRRPALRLPHPGRLVGGEHGAAMLATSGRDTPGSPRPLRRGFIPPLVDFELQLRPQPLSGAGTRAPTSAIRASAQPAGSGSHERDDPSPPARQRQHRRRRPRLRRRAAGAPVRVGAGAAFGGDGGAKAPGRERRLHPPARARGRPAHVRLPRDPVQRHDNQAVSLAKGKTTVPSPILAFDQNDGVRLDLTNVGFITRPDLDDAHTIHWHGFRNAIAIFDGTPEMSIAVPPNRTFPYYYQPRDPGTYMYHCHFEDVEHVQMGMTGVVYVRPTMGPKFAYNDASTAFDREFTLLLNEVDPRPHDGLLAVQEFQWVDYRPRFWVINMRAWPDTIKAPDDPSLAVYPTSDPVGELPEDLLADPMQPERQGAPADRRPGLRPARDDAHRHPHEGDRRGRHAAPQARYRRQPHRRPQLRGRTRSTSAPARAATCSSRRRRSSAAQRRS